MANKISYTESPLAAGSFMNWIELYSKNKPIEPKYRLRAAFVSFMSFMFMPFRIVHRLLYNNKIKRTSIHKQPVFIIGHFRSGTTYLQNLLAQDKQFGYITTTQTLLPEMFLMGNWVNTLLRIFLPEKRPMDNVKMAPEFPEESEHALGNISQYCFYHGFCFPKKMQYYYKKYVLFENVNSNVINKWKNDYLYVIKSATYSFGGKQIFIKNPPDTARIPYLLEMFPNAKFIFLHRNPYVMFPSIKNFYSKSLLDWQFNEINSDELEENIFFIYESMIKKYEQTKHLIPQNNLIEVKFEDLELKPIETMQNIYVNLGIENFESAKNHFTQYANSQKSYEKNKYKPSPALLEKISTKWKEDIERWNYKPEIENISI